MSRNRQSIPRIGVFAMVLALLLSALVAFGTTAWADTTDESTTIPSTPAPSPDPASDEEPNKASEGTDETSAPEKSKESKAPEATTPEPMPDAPDTSNQEEKAPKESKESAPTTQAEVENPVEPQEHDFEYAWTDFVGDTTMASMTNNSSMPTSVFFQLRHGGDEIIDSTDSQILLPGETRTEPLRAKFVDGVCKGWVIRYLSDDVLGDEKTLSSRVPENEPTCSEPEPPADTDLDGDNVDGDEAGSPDKCQDTPQGETVDAAGCSASQRDEDGDGVKGDTVGNPDKCANTPKGESVNADGCSSSQLDSDGDGVKNDKDQCAYTPAGTKVDKVGCPLVDPLPSQCSEGSNPGDLNGDGKADEGDCEVPPTCPSGTDVTDMDGDGKTECSTVGTPPTTPSPKPTPSQNPPHNGGNDGPKPSKQPHKGNGPAPASSIGGTTPFTGAPSTGDTGTSGSDLLGWPLAALGLAGLIGMTALRRRTVLR